MLPRRLDKRNKTAASQEAAVFLLEGDGSGTDDIPVPVEGFLGSPVSGVIIGAVLMGVINLGMSVMGIDQNYQKVVKGLVLLAAVIFDVVSKRNDSK